MRGIHIGHLPIADAMREMIAARRKIIVTVIIFILQMNPRHQTQDI